MTQCHRRDAILATAEPLFRHYGPAKTTMADIAREAGVGVGSVYLEFAANDALIEALSRARHASVLCAMREALSRGDDWAAQYEYALRERDRLLGEGPVPLAFRLTNGLF